MRTLNLGILAHVDAGKTSLTERLLFNVGVIAKLGSVDAGTTQTDTLALERQRGITIKAAVAAFRLGDTVVNLVDTPGHPDFIAEVERTLAVLDAAIVVVSAVEGVQAQTRVLVRALRRLGIPMLFFVNKVDRLGANYERVTQALADQLQLRVLLMSTVEEAGTKSASVTALTPDRDPHRTAVIDVLAENDDALLGDYVMAPAGLTAQRLHNALATQVAAGLVQPAFAGSAATGAGVGELITAIETLLPSRAPDPAGPLEGRIFKIDRGWGGEKQAYLSLTAGTLQLRQAIELPRGEGKITSIQVFEDGKLLPATRLTAGQIGRITGLPHAVIGDTLGHGAGAGRMRYFQPPTLETRILPVRPSDQKALWTALGQLAEQDPLINLRHDEAAAHIYVSLYGEVQKQVIEAMLALDYGLAVEFLESTIVCVEKLLGPAEAVEIIHQGANPFYATVGLRLEPRPELAGNSFSIEANTGLMPTGFYRAVEETVHEALKQGPSGWQVIDCHVAMIAAGQEAPITVPADFRKLTPLVLARALTAAKTVVCEPISRFRLDAPAATTGVLLTALGQAAAAITGTTVENDMVRLEGTVATAMLDRLQRQLPDLTAGAGALEAGFDHYAPLSGDAPTRPRTGLDPYRREDYLLRA